MAHLTYYPRQEEKWNVITHLVGLLFSMAGLVLLIVFASLEGTVWHVVSFTIFGVSMVILYLASTLYHSAVRQTWRRRLNVFDHAAIYVLIAGTYTPFSLVTLQGTLGWILFGVTWGLALVGIILKIFFTGRFSVLSTVAYVAMGWLAVVVGKSLYESLDPGAFWLLVMGGLSYTLGAVIYSFERIPYNHAIFHIFVLMGTGLHFSAIFFYL